MSTTANTAIGERIAALRAARGLSQAELAAALGLAHKQVVSNLEKGARSLKATELASLAEVFHVSPLAILGLQPLDAPRFVLWRQTAGEKATHDGEAAFLDRCRRYAFLERLARLDPQSLPFRFDCDPHHTSFETAAEWAGAARKALGLGETPAPGLQLVLENQFGVKIFVTPLTGASGAAYRGELGDAILLNAGESAGRRAFSLAHELFHLLTWDTAVSTQAHRHPAEGERLEKLAENFAAALLLPREALEERLPPADAASWSVLQWVELARAFGVTVPALAWRLVNLARLSPDGAQRIINDPSRAQAGSRAPVEERPLPERYVTLAFKAYVEEEISIGKLAEVLETSVGRLPKVLASYGFDLDSDVWQAPALPA